MSRIAVKVSPEAVSALLTTGTNRQGSVPQLAPGSPVWAELRAAGLVGERDGLTRLGSITRQREAQRLMDDLFPLG